MQFDFRLYQRRFCQPLRTSYGLWSIRKGMIVRLKDETGQVGYGEIAPIEAFGTESIEQAIEFCQQLPDEIDGRAIAEIPDTLPTCQFGFESALRELSLRFERFQPPKSPILGDFKKDSEVQRPPLVGDLGGIRDCQSKRATFVQDLTYSVLLPTGETALQTWKNFWEQGYRTFKLKIGVNPIQQEIKTLEKLRTEIPNQALLRLDANGGLNESETQQWLEFCQGSNIEFLEQPLPVEAFETMLKFANHYTTPIALDESVTTIAQLQDCYDRGWRGIFVIKPAIAGFPSRLRRFCQTYAIDTVFSSVFETAIARQAGLALASELSDRAVGYGTTHWFSELMMDDFDAIWNSL